GTPHPGPRPRCDGASRRRARRVGRADDECGGRAFADSRGRAAGEEEGGHRSGGRHDDPAVVPGLTAVIMKKLLAWLLIAAAVAVGLLAAACGHFMRSDAVSGGEPVAVEIARGERAAALFERLVSGGVLEASPLWRLAIKLERP